MSKNVKQEHPDIFISYEPC